MFFLSLYPMTEDTKIYGIRAIIEAIEAGKDIEKVYLKKELEGDLFKELESLIKSKRISSSYVPEIKIEKLSKGRNHQGAVAKVAPISFQDFEITINRIIKDIESPIFLMLDQISDTRNFGAIVRTAECTGVSAIIIPKTGSAPITADAVKTSAGAIFNIPICKVDHIKDAIYYLQSCDVKIVAATEKTDNTIYDVPLTGSHALIMGSEGRGINPSVLKIVDYKAKLPLLGKIESLNVSVATGAFLYEAIRQRQ